MPAGLLRGAAAGAAGTTALNAVTYLDMAVRGRPSSSTPEQTVERLSEVAHVPVPGEGETHDNRVSGLGPLTGLVAGVGTGVALGLARAAGCVLLLPAVDQTVEESAGGDDGSRSENGAAVAQTDALHPRLVVFLREVRCRL